MGAVGQYGDEALLSAAGTLLANTAVTVLNPDNSHATLYTDLTGTVTTANPINTDTKGNLLFFAAPGQYNLVVGSSTFWPVNINLPGWSMGVVGGPAGPLNSSGQIPLGQLPPATVSGLLIYNVKSSPYNAAGNGVADDTMAIASAITACAATGGTVFLPPGVYKTSSQLAVTTTNVNLLGINSACTVIQPTFAGDAIRWKMASFAPGTMCGRIGGIAIDGSLAPAGACGFHFGDAMNGEIDDLNIQNFAGAGSVGIHCDNTAFYTEGWEWGRCYVANCTIGVLFDVQPSQSNSFGYTRIRHLRLDCNNGQVGMRLQNGALIYNSVVGISANLAGGSTLMQVAGITGSGVTGMGNCLYYIQAEQDGSGSANGLVLSQFASMTGTGVIDLSSGSIASSLGSPNPGSLDLSGWMKIPGTAVGYTKFSGTVATTATAGSATLPSAPAAFVDVAVNGVPFKLPLYNV